MSILRSLQKPALVLALMAGSGYVGYDIGFKRGQRTADAPQIRTELEDRSGYSISPISTRSTPETGTGAGRDPIYSERRGDAKPIETEPEKSRIVFGWKPDFTTEDLLSEDRLSKMAKLARSVADIVKEKGKIVGDGSYILELEIPNETHRDPQGRAYPRSPTSVKATYTPSDDALSLDTHSEYGIVIDYGCDGLRIESAKNGKEDLFKSRYKPLGSFARPSNFGELNVSYRLALQQIRRHFGLTEIGSD